MQHGLVREQYVSIMFDLIPQLNKDIVIIPSNIRLELRLRNTSTQIYTQRNISLRYKVLTRLLDFNKDFIHDYTQENEDSPTNPKINLCQDFILEESMLPDYDQLVILTSTEAYRGHEIDVDASSLTIPNVLFGLNKIAKKNRLISINYEVSECPNFTYQATPSLH